MDVIISNTTLTSYLYLSCFLGAIGQEVLHWYNLKLELNNDVKFYSSPTYWVITMVSIIFFALTAKLLAPLAFPNQEEPSDTILFITAFGYPIIIKNVLKLITKTFNRTEHERKQKPNLTRNNNTNFEITDYIKNH